MPITISSLSNGRIKETLKLAKHSVREARRLTVVEGERECARALQAGIVPVEAYLCRSLLSPTGQAVADRLAQLDAQRHTFLAEVTPEVFAKLAYREDSGGILLVIPYITRPLPKLPLRAPAFLAVIEGVEKPGNLGAILRTADAAGVHAVIVSAGATDVHNPNVVRASLGTLFTVPVVEAAPAATIAWLRQQQIAIIAASPEATQRYTKVDYAGAVAVVMGSEATGLSEQWRAAATELVAIPMLGIADSLNLATSTALMLYEVVRQRGL